MGQHWAFPESLGHLKNACKRLVKGNLLPGDFNSLYKSLQNHWKYFKVKKGWKLLANNEHKELHKSVHESYWSCTRQVPIMALMNNSHFYFQVFGCLLEGCAEPHGSGG